MTERWLPVVGHERWEVSDLGRVRNSSRGNVLTQHRGSKRSLHMKVWLSTHHCWTHVLVCEAFHGLRPSPQHEVRHKNGVGDDNRAENLEWGTRSDQRFDDVRNDVHHWAKRDSCSRGHKYTPENTVITSWGARRCMECRRTSGREYMRRKRAKESA